MNGVVKKAVVLTAGMGLRSLPATKAVPKAMLASFGQARRAVGVRGSRPERREGNSACGFARRRGSKAFFQG